MGTIILIVAIVVQAAFAAWCIATKSNQQKVKSVVRIGAFGVFVLLTLVSVIQWGYRWYAFAALLLIWAAFGAWSLLRQRARQTEFKVGRTLFNAAGVLLLVVIALIPAFVFPQHKSPQVTGKYAVATSSDTFVDQNRIETFTGGAGKRQVNVQCWYPIVEQGKYPLVVFSPGSFGIKASNTSTFLDLVSNGYVVCSIDHPYHSLFTRGTDGHMVTMDQSFLQEVVGANNGKYDDATEFALEKKWMALRIEDIDFVVNTILARVSNTTDGFYQRIDSSKIGLMGHSLGGESSAQVARNRHDIGAVVNLDADLGGEYVAYVNGKYVMEDSAFPVPILTILTDDLVRLIDAIPDANTVVAVKHVSATAPQAYEVYIAGTDHMSLTDLPLVSPLLVSMITSSVKKVGGGASADKMYVIEKMNELTLKFFNAYLKGNGTFAPAATY